MSDVEVPADWMSIGEYRRIEREQALTKPPEIIHVDPPRTEWEKAAGFETPVFFSYEELKVYATKAIEARGEEYIYPKVNSTCVYVDWTSGQASCLVGQMLEYMDILDPKVTPTWNDSGARELFQAERLFTTDDRGATFLVRLQALQDNHVPWGEAFQNAVEIAEGYIPERHINDA